MLASELADQLLDIVLLFAVSFQTVKDPFFVQMDDLEWRRLLRELNQASNLVEVIEINPLAKKLPKLEAFMNITRKLFRESETAHFFQVLKEGDNYLFLHSASSPLIKKP